jgi:isoleucyl-tRNA synthetase
MATLWNTYSFFVLYANIDDFDPTKYTLDTASLSAMDKWLLSRLQSVIEEYDNHLANYRIPEASRVLQDFVDELSNWYVRRSRERFWGKDMPQDKINAYMTLYTALVTVAKASAPMIPFMAEDIYRNLVCENDPTAPASVHLCAYPEVNEAYIDTALEIIEKTTKIGFDKTHGGIIAFTDCKGYPPVALEWDMKLWWPQCEAMIAFRMAAELTGEEKYKKEYESLLEYTEKNFVDTECGEWYGYLHYDNTPSTTLKGNIFKGPFHVPRFYMIMAMMDEGRYFG